MSKLNFLVFLNTYSDPSSSNAPSLSNFSWSRNINGIPASNPLSEALSLAPGESKTLFSGTRSLNSDSSTVYSISLKPLSSNVYRILNTSGLAPDFRTPRSISSLALTTVSTAVNGPVVTFSAPVTVAGTFASYTGGPPGVAFNVSVTADTEGAIGNSILITYDGIQTVTQGIVAWNIANPDNTAYLSGGDGTQIPDAGGQIQLSGGVTAAYGWNISSVQVGDEARIGDQFNVLNQGKYKIISKTAQSFTVENQVAVTEGPITLGSGFANQISIYSASGVQVGDTLLLSSGFSAVTLGSYNITDVSAEYIEFYSASVLPQESGITNPGLAIYSAAKNLIYIESDQKVSVTVNGSQVSSIEPFIINDSKQPGVFMLKSTIYSLSIQNSSLDSASLFVASVE